MADTAGKARKRKISADTLNKIESRVIVAITAKRDSIKDNPQERGKWNAILRWYERRIENRTKSVEKADLESELSAL